MKNVALITGGSRGIGLGIAQSLAREGFDLVINGVREESKIGDALESLRSLGAEVHYAQADVRDMTTHQGMLEPAINRFGHLNVLINNAGVAPLNRADVLTMSEDSYERVMGINLKSIVFLSQVAANYFIEKKKEDANFPAFLINISSVSATMVSVNRAEYCISKAGASMATQLFAVRLASEDIPVYEVRPGVTRSDMTAGVEEKYDKLIADGLCPQPRWGEPEDVGRAVVALVRGDFPYSTGQVIMVDGAMTIPRL